MLQLQTAVICYHKSKTCGSWDDLPWFIFKLRTSIKLRNVGVVVGIRYAQCGSCKLPLFVTTSRRLAVAGYHGTTEFESPSVIF